jgi:hypothetical protein
MIYEFDTGLGRSRDDGEPAVRPTSITPLPDLETVVTDEPPVTPDPPVSFLDPVLDRVSEIRERFSPTTVDPRTSVFETAADRLHTARHNRSRAGPFCRFRVGGQAHH